MTLSPIESGVNLIFTPDTRSSLVMTADIVNTLPGTTSPDVDGLVDLDDLAAYLQVHPYSGTIRHDATELEAIRRIRPRLRELWSLDRDSAVPLVNAMLHESNAVPRLVRGGRGGEERDVLFFGRAGGATGTAIDARGAHRRDELPVEAAIARLDGAIALGEARCVDGGGCHGIHSATDPRHRSAEIGHGRSGGITPA